MRKWHRWLSLFFGVFMLWMAVTGLIIHVTDLLKGDDDHQDKPVAAADVLNGFGKSVGLMQIEELGQLETPVLLTTTLSVGTCANALIRRAVAANPDLEVVRRWTGGGTVLHGQDAPYSLIVPRNEPFAARRPADSYSFIHSRLAFALSEAFPELKCAAQDAPKSSAACFENPVKGDLILGSHKIAGAAQRRTRQGLLHQGSVHLSRPEFPQALKFARSLSATVEAFVPQL